MNDDLKLLIYVLFILVCAGIVGTFDREAEELTQTHTRDAALHKTADNLLINQMSTWIHRSMDGRELRESD